MDIHHKSKILHDWDEFVRNTDIRKFLPILKSKGKLSPDDIQKIEDMDEFSKSKHFYKMMINGKFGSTDEILKIFNESSHSHLAALLSRPDSRALHPLAHAQEISAVNKCSAPVVENSEMTSSEMPVQEQNTLQSVPEIRLSQPLARKHEEVQHHASDVKCSQMPNCTDTVTDTYSRVEQPLEIIVKKATEFKDLPDSGPAKYPMRSKNRGAYLIINNIEFDNDPKGEKRRLGAEADHMNLLNLFNQLNFRGEDYKNLTQTEMMDKIKNFTKSEFLNKVDCCVIVIMSHGDEDNNKPFVYTRDNYHYDLSQLKNAFNNKNCIKLRRIPKIFLFQCCRGEFADKAIAGRPTRVSEGVLSVDGGIPNLPTYSDMLQCWSTVSGFASFRESITGTWFIEAICEIWANWAHEYHVEDLMKLVQEKFETKKTIDYEMQTTTVENTSFKICYLNPGLYNETASNGTNN